VLAAVTCAAAASSSGCGGTPAAAAHDGGDGGTGGGGTGGRGTGGGAGTGGDAAGAGGSGTSLSVSGNVLGVPFVPTDIAANSNGSTGAGSFPSLELSVTDVAGGACDDLPRRRADSHVLRIYIFNEQDQTAIGPGTYTYFEPAVGMKFVTMVWHAFGEAVDGACGSAPDHWASAATITLTEVSATRVVGSFDATLEGDGFDAGALDASVGHISGTFSAPICPIVDGGATNCF
jgi:hypothetical protein